MEWDGRGGSGLGMRLLTVVGLLTLVPALVLAGMRFAPSQSYVPAAQVVGLFVLAAPLALAATLLFAGTRRWWLAGLAVIVCGATLFGASDRVMDGTVSPAQAEGTARVGAVNAYFGRADADALTRSARAFELDVLCVAEATPDFAAALETAGLHAYLPEVVSAAEPGASGTMLFSRWPLQELDQVEGVSFRMPRAIVTTPAGVEITVTCAHPAPPNPTRRALALWDRELRAIGSTVAETSGPQIVMGDFNATWDHRLLRDVAAAGGLHDAAIVAGQGLTPTWPLRDGPVPFPFVTIDHVLTDLPVAAADVVEIVGSDHAMITAELLAQPFTE